MFGYVVWPARGFAVETLPIAGVRFLRVDLPARMDWRMKRVVSRAAGQMKRHGIRRAVFPETFPYVDLFRRHDILPVSDLALRRAVAARMLLCRMEGAGLRPARSTAALLAEAPTEEAALLLCELADEVRYLSLWAGSGGERMAARLRWERGVAVRVLEPTELFRGADGALLLDRPVAETAVPPLSLALWQGSEGDVAAYFSLPKTVGNPSPNQLLGALFVAGRIKKEDFSPKCS